MPYRKYYGKRYRKRYYKKKNSTAKDAMTVASAALRLGKKMVRFVNTEVKTFETSDSSAVINDAGVLYKLDTIAQGDDYDNRDGISIKPLRVTIRGNCVINTSATHSQLRLIILRGKNENGTNVAVSDIFDSTGVLQSKTHDKRFKTKILWDRTFTLTSAANTLVSWQKSIKLFGHIQYDASTTTGGLMENGGLYLIAIGSETVNDPKINFTSKLTFVDN